MTKRLRIVQGMTKRLRTVQGMTKRLRTVQGMTRDCGQYRRLPETADST
ncbi:unnamed protein product, partial [Staurois parvus]